MLLEHKGMFYFVSFPSQDQGGTVNGLFHFMLVEGLPWSGGPGQYSFANEFQPNKILNSSDRLDESSRN